jgi:hypothetical protein
LRQGDGVRADFIEFNGITNAGYLVGVPVVRVIEDTTVWVGPLDGVRGSLCGASQHDQSRETERTPDESKPSSHEDPHVSS